MKKLIFSLFAIATIFVACNKETTESIEPSIIEMEEVSASVDLDIDSLTDRLIRLSNNKNLSPKDNSTNRTPGGHIKLISGVNTTSNTYYEFLFSDDLDLCNVSNVSYLETIWLVLDGTETDIHIISETGPVIGTITADLSFIYGLTITEGLSVNLGNLDVAVVDGAGGVDITLGSERFNFTCATASVWAPSASDANMISNPDYGTYSVSPAPFPLTGFLATYISAATGVSQPANYAGTTRDAVMTAIQNDFAD